ncbi:MAG: ABC transporter permease [Bacteroidaceae bacterium]|nr:ABC transporter permease [Bacteroidaceae bacterium]
MNYLNLFKIALKAIYNNKTRSLLTMLGIIIGIASVIAMLGFGQGTQEQITNEISSMGSNMIMINPGGERRAGQRMDASSMQTLKMEDYEAIRNECDHVSYVSPSVSSSGQLVAGNNNYPASVTGCSEDYLKIRQLEMAEGDMFTEQEVKTAAKVVVLGKTIVDNLFPYEDPIGKSIRVNQIPFRVIGVLESKGTNSMGMDQDEIVLAPFTTVMKRMLSQSHLQGIQASALTEADTDAAMDEIETVLRRNHRLKEGDENNFTMNSMQEIMETMNTVTGMLTMLLAAIAGISLVVGGIGIMNIMYVSVTERTKEIGLRMSVGARGIDILSQFLIEAVLICLTGGIIGIMLGYGLGALVSMLSEQVSVSISGSSVLLSFSVCVLIGMFFGWYPAKKAANLDPIEALRYE